MSYQPDFSVLLKAGSRVHREGVEYLIEDRAIGAVTVPSGQIVGCDPLADGAPRPFTATVPPGRYELHAWVAALHQDGRHSDTRTVALQLVVGDQPAVRWDLALTAGQDPAALGADAFYGYPVDAGVGTLADLVAVQALAQWDYDRLEDVYIPARIEPAPAPIDAVTDEATKANVITVSSGWGDGVYPTFIGRTADGHITSFVTDFMVIPAPPAGL